MADSYFKLGKSFEDLYSEIFHQNYFHGFKKYLPNIRWCLLRSIPDALESPLIRQEIYHPIKKVLQKIIGLKGLIFSLNLDLLIESQFMTVKNRELFYFMEDLYFDSGLVSKFILQLQRRELPSQMHIKKLCENGIQIPNSSVLVKLHGSLGWFFPRESLEHGAISSVKREYDNVAIWGTDDKSKRMEKFRQDCLHWSCKIPVIAKRFFVFDNVCGMQ